MHALPAARRFHPFRPMGMLLMQRFLATATAAVAGGPGISIEQADVLWQRQQWPAAADAYAEIVKDNDYNGRFWFRFGYACHAAGRYSEAIPAFQKCLAMGEQPNESTYNIACGYALLGETEAALDWLDKALLRGIDSELVKGDSDLTSIRDEPRYRELLGLVDEAPASRDDAWRADIRTYQKEMPRRHANAFHAVTPQQFNAAIDALCEKAPNLADHEIIVEMMRITAMIGDGHTRFDIPHGQGKYAFHGFPVRLFRDRKGLFVYGVTDTEYTHLLGARVDRINGVPALEAFERVLPLAPRDNELNLIDNAARFLSIREVLAAVGVLDSVNAKMRLDLDVDGSPRTLELEAQAFDHMPALIQTTPGKEPPLWLRDTESTFWFRPLPEINALYVQFNQVRDGHDETVAHFFQRVRRYIEAKEVDRLILDLRHNGGGNNFLNKGLVQAVIQCERINKPGHLFTLIGRRTFSAAMCLAVDLERQTETLFAGEPTGSRPNFHGETKPTTLPHTGLGWNASTLYWQNALPWDERLWIGPDIVGELSAEDFRAGRDPGLEAVIHYIKRNPQNAVMRAMY